MKVLIVFALAALVARPGYAQGAKRDPKEILAHKIECMKVAARVEKERFPDGLNFPESIKEGFIYHAFEYAYSEPLNTCVLLTGFHSVNAAASGGSDDCCHLRTQEHRAERRRRRREVGRATGRERAGVREGEGLASTDASALIPLLPHLPPDRKLKSGPHPCGTENDGRDYADGGCLQISHSRVVGQSDR